VREDEELPVPEAFQSRRKALRIKARRIQVHTTHTMIIVNDIESEVPLVGTPSQVFFNEEISEDLNPLAPRTKVMMSAVIPKTSCTVRSISKITMILGIE
jgi:hypothetical protein